MAVFAPMPRARVRMAITVNPGVRARVRRAYLKSRNAVSRAAIVFISRTLSFFAVWMTTVNTLFGGNCSREDTALASRIDWARRHKFETNLRGKRLVDWGWRRCREWSATADNAAAPRRRD